jgi:hypothetical protein
MARRTRDGGILVSKSHIKPHVQAIPSRLARGMRKKHEQAEGFFLLEESASAANKNRRQSGAQKQKNSVQLHLPLLTS